MNLLIYIIVEIIISLKILVESEMKRKWIYDIKKLKIVFFFNSLIIVLYKKKF